MIKKNKPINKYFFPNLYNVCVESESFDETHLREMLQL